MTTYTTVADSNGDFTVPFSTSYKSGEKVTVTAEKDGLIKNIELFAPSSVFGGGSILFSGNLNNFPLNIGVMTLAGISGKIQNDAFRCYSVGSGLGAATGLIIDNGVTEIGVTAFYNFSNLTSLVLPSSLAIIRSSSFALSSSSRKLSNLIIPDSVAIIEGYAFEQRQAEKIEIGSGITNIGYEAFNCSLCTELIVHANTPPAITSTSFRFVGNQSGMIIKVPLASVSAYKSASNWSAYAARIVGY